MTVAEVQAPEKELRFTRSGQAVGFWILAAVLAAAGITLIAASLYRDVNPRIPHAAWALIPFALAGGLVKLAIDLTRHAYLILTPIGIEIFPFFRPAAGMQMVLWQELDSAEVDEKLTLLTLHRDAAKSSGLHLTLRPLRGDRRELLVRAVLGRLRDRAG